MTATETLTITDFLLARIAEDEAAVYRWDSDGPNGAVVATLWTGEAPGYTTVAASSVEGVWVADGREVEARHAHILFDPARVLAECKAKREIVELAEEATGLDMTVDQDRLCGARDWPYVGDLILAHLAAVYASHPDYDPAWAPES